MSVAVELEDTAHAEAVSFDGSVLVVHASRGFAPGAPVQLRVRLDDRELALRGKTRAPKRRAEGDFELRFELLNLRRSEREALQAALPYA